MADTLSVLIDMRDSLRDLPERLAKALRSRGEYGDLDEGYDGRGGGKGKGDSGDGGGKSEEGGIRKFLRGTGFDDLADAISKGQQRFKLLTETLGKVTGGLLGGIGKTIGIPGGGYGSTIKPPRPEAEKAEVPKSLTPPEPLTVREKAFVRHNRWYGSSPREPAQTVPPPPRPETKKPLDTITPRGVPGLSGGHAVSRGGEGEKPLSPSMPSLPPIRPAFPELFYNPPELPRSPTPSAPTSASPLSSSPLSPGGEHGAERMVGVMEEVVDLLKDLLKTNKDVLDALQEANRQDKESPGKSGMPGGQETPGVTRAQQKVLDSHRILGVDPPPGSSLRQRPIAAE